MIGFGKWTRKLRLSVFLALAAIGCTSAKEASGPTVLEIKGNKLTQEEVRWSYDHQTAPGAFDAATPQQRTEFLTTIGDKEILLAFARERAKDLPAMERMQLQETNDNALLKALERAVVTPVQQDSVAEYYLRRFQRQVHLMIFITPSDSIAAVARAEVEAGTPFSDVVLKWCKDQEVVARKGDIGWKTPETMGREFAMELWVDEREPGYLSQIHRTPGGAIFYQVLGVRDEGPPANPAVMKMLPQLAQVIRSYNVMMAHLDSLRQANGFEIVAENVPVLMKGMNSYWDSLSAAAREEGAKPKEFTPPLSRFGAAEREKPLYKLRNKTASIGDFVRGLRDISPKLWPMGEDMEANRKKIDYRVVSSLQLKEARARGLDRSLDYVMSARTEEEKLRLGDYVLNAVSPGIAVSPEEIRAYYDKNLDRYRTKEMIRFSYVIFPTKSEATRFWKEALPKELNWWSDQLGELHKNRHDVVVRFNSPQYDLSLAVPDTVQMAVKAGWEGHVGQILEPQPTVGDRWMVPRVTFRQRAGVNSFEKVKASIEATLKDLQVDARIAKLVEEGKTRFGLKLFPDRLGTKG